MGILRVIILLTVFMASLNGYYAIRRVDPVQGISLRGSRRITFTDQEDNRAAVAAVVYSEHDNHGEKDEASNKEKTIVDSQEGNKAEDGSSAISTSPLDNKDAFVDIINNPEEFKGEENTEATFEGELKVQQDAKAALAAVEYGHHGNHDEKDGTEEENAEDSEATR